MSDKQVKTIAVIQAKVAYNEMLSALEYYKNGVDHFYNCIDFGKSFLDADAITWMNTVGIKINAAIRAATGEGS